MWKLIIIFMVVIMINGCQDNQRNVNFKMENIELKGNDLNFKFKDLECSAQWELKENEKGLLTENDVDISDKIKFNKGVLKDLKCNQELKCNENKCETDKYYINLDPEIGEKEIEIGYEFLDNNKVVHIWNTQDAYYFNITSGIQFTNHYQDYWTRNIFCLGYYDNDEWIKIKCADELSNFNKNIETDNLTYVNATLWKDISYGNYDLRLGIQYHLGLNDEKLSITIYAKNIGIDIPFDLGFAWKIKDIEIPNNTKEDIIYINRTFYNLNDNLNIIFSDMQETVNLSYSILDNETNITTWYEEYETVYFPFFEIRDNEYLRLDWNETLNYKVKLYSDGNQENAYVMLLINAGYFNSHQEKSTTFYWIDAEGDYISKWSLQAGNSDPIGITTDGSNFWVVDMTDKEVYKYDMSGSYISKWSLQAGSTFSHGITTDGSNIWVTEESNKEVYKYQMDGTYVTKWSLQAGNNAAYGIATDGSNFWVAELGNSEVYKYEMDGTYVTKWSVYVSSGRPTGITTDGSNIWTVDNDNDKVWKYDMDGGYISDWSTNVDNAYPIGITIYGSNFWVVDRTDDEVYKYEGPPPVDTCTYSGSGNWDVTCSDNCTITSAVVGDGSNLNIGTDAGFFNVGADISNFNLIHIDSGCIVTCQGGNCLK